MTGFLLDEAQLLVLLRRAHKGERPAHIVLELYANTKELEQEDGRD